SARDDRSVPVLVDHQDPLCALAADNVLDRTADAARDVEVRRDPRAGLANLVRVRAPAEIRDDARAADGPAQQGRERLEQFDSFLAPHSAAAADDDAGGVEAA